MSKRKWTRQFAAGMLSVMLAVTMVPADIVSAAEGRKQEEKSYEIASRGFATENESEDGEWVYGEYEDGTICVLGFYGAAISRIVIPEEIDGQIVTGIAPRSQMPGFPPGFRVSDKNIVTSVVLPDTVSHIEPKTFENFANMERIILPNNDKLEAQGIFKGCSSLVDITMANTYLGGCFSDPQEVIIETVTYHEGVEDVQLADGGGSIYLEGHLDHLKTINLPNSIKKLSITGCDNLTTLNCDKPLSQINITSLTGCKNLHVEVKTDRFNDYSNSGITKLTVDVSKVSKYDWRKEWLKNCTSLQEIVLEGTNDYFFAKDGMLCWRAEASDKNYDILCYPAGRSTATDFTIPEDVKCIYYPAFDGCKFTSITIPENISSRFYYDFGYDFQNYEDISFLSGNHATLRLPAYSVADVSDGDASGLEEYLNISFGRVVYYKKVCKHTTTETVNAKSATITANGYTGDKVCTKCGSIIKKGTAIDFPKTIKLSKTSFVYNGKPQSPTVTIADASGKPISNQFYTVTYDNNKNVGTATVTITFHANYSGTITKTFQILPKSTAISKLSAKKKGFTAKWKKQTSQTNGYQLQYSMKKNFKGAKTVTITKNKTTNKSISKLKTKKKYYVRIRTYKKVKVNGKYTKICSNWSKTKTVTTRR